MARRTQSENPHKLTTGSIAAATDDTDATDGSTYGDNEEFFLRNSEYFSVEWKVTGTLSTGFDLKLHMKTFDGTWIPATDGATSKEALVTAETSARGFVKPDVPYSRGAYKLVVDNNEVGNAITVELLVHQANSGMR